MAGTSLLIRFSSAPQYQRLDTRVLPVIDFAVDR
jgi:hypothetical protein